MWLREMSALEDRAEATARPVDQFLRGLTGGMPLASFNDEVRERRVAHFKAALEPTLLESVFNLPRLERLLREEAELAPYLDVFDGADLRQFVDRQREPGQTYFDVVSHLLLRGATIRLRSAE